MSRGYWQAVQGAGFEVPSDRPLDDLTAELTTMLGSVEPDLRDGTAYPALATWIQRGVYDDLLRGLGDGIVVGLEAGLGEVRSDSVFRRSFSALILAECIARDNAHHLLPGQKVVEWGDRLATWYLREQDTRGFVPGKGWAHALAHGADAIGVLAESPHFAGPELGVLLDVLAERLLMTDGDALLAGETDRMAAAAMQILRRNVVGIGDLERWVQRLGASAGAYGRGVTGEDPFFTTNLPQAFLRALFVQLSLAASPPAVRPDLLLVVIDALRATNAPLLEAD